MIVVKVSKAGGIQYLYLLNASLDVRFILQDMGRLYKKNKAAASE